MTVLPPPAAQPNCVEPSTRSPLPWTTARTRRVRLLGQRFRLYGVRPEDRLTGSHIDQPLKVFLGLLDRFMAANRDVSDKTGQNYAPSLFVKEDEAKLAQLRKRDLEGAMRRLFRDGRIVNELRPGSRPSRPSYRIVPVKSEV